MRDEGYVRAAAARQAPRGSERVGERVCSALDRLASDAAGDGGRNLTPIVAAAFLFVVALNALVLSPGLTWSAGRIGTTVGLCSASFALAQYCKIRQSGLRNYVNNFFEGPALVKPIMGMLRLIAEFLRPLSSASRLLSDVLGRDVAGAILVLASVEVLGSVLIPVRIPTVLSTLLASFVAATAVSMSVAACLAERPEQGGRHGAPADGQEQGELVERSGASHAAEELPLGPRRL